MFGPIFSQPYTPCIIVDNKWGCLYNIPDHLFVLKIWRDGLSYHHVDRNRITVT